MAGLRLSVSFTCSIRLDSRQRHMLPTTVAGLLMHIAEHTARHVGQAISAAKLARIEGVVAGRSDHRRECNGENTRGIQVLIKRRGPFARDLPRCSTASSTPPPSRSNEPGSGTGATGATVTEAAAVK
jgi:hypothetical protein